MKKFFYFLLALPLVFAACDKNPEPEPVVKDPVLNVTETTINIAAEGGEGVINYTVENAVEGTEVTATCAAEWVLDLTVAETITFSVEANEGEAREAAIVVAYGELEKTVAVKQAAKQEAPAAPVFELVGEAVVEYAWNDIMGEVEFKLENPVAGVEASAKSAASWLSQFQIANNKIQFAIAENRGEAREAKVTAEYGMLSFEFTVKQGAYVAPDPVLTVTETELEFAPEGGEGSFTYTLENPVEGVELQAAADVEWISNVTAAEGVVSFTVAQNEGEVRSGKISLTYGELKAEVAVKQYFPGYDPDMTYGVMDLNNAKATMGENNTWDLIFFETVENLGNDNMTRITVQLPEANNMHITSGSYSSADGSILLQTNSEATSELSFFRYNSTAQLMQACELNVEVDTEACTTKFTGKITVAGAIYTFEWDGAVDGFMYKEIGEEGITDWKNVYIYSQWKQNAKFDSSSLWMVSTDGVKINLFIRNSDNPVEKGFAAGTYNLCAWNARYGICDDASKVNDVLLTSAEVVVEMVGEDYKITFNIVDENGNEWKGSYQGPIEFTNYTHPA